MSVRRSVLLGVLALLSACQGPASISIRIVGHLADKRDNSVDILIYRLKDDKGFLGASDADLWTRPQEVLGSQQVGPAVPVRIYTGDAGDTPKLVELGQLPDNVRFVGVFALTAKPKGPRRILLKRDELGAVIRVAGHHLEVEK